MENVPDIGSAAHTGAQAHCQAGERTVKYADRQQNHVRVGESDLPADIAPLDEIRREASEEGPEWTRRTGAIQTWLEKRSRKINNTRKLRIAVDCRIEDPRQGTGTAVLA